MLIAMSTAHVRAISAADHLSVATIHVTCECSATTVSLVCGEPDIIWTAGGGGGGGGGGGVWGGGGYISRACCPANHAYLGYVRQLGGDMVTPTVESSSQAVVVPLLHCQHQLLLPA